jgi:dihydrofolate reductase
LRVHPITLGHGKRLFGDGAIPAAFRLVEHQVTSTGVVLAIYERAGALPSSDG